MLLFRKRHTDTRRFYVMLVSGQRTVTAYWFTGAKNGSAVLTFTNGRLTSKSQSNLE